MEDLKLIRTARGAVAEAIYGERRRCNLTLIRPHTQIADSTAVYVVDGNYIVHFSPPTFPDAAAKHAEAIERMKPALGEAAYPVPPIVAQGLVEGRSFVILPRYTPLRTGRIGGRIDRLRVKGRLLKWVFDVVQQAEAPSANASRAFSTCIETLKNVPGVNRDVVKACDQASDQMLTGGVLPRHVPMHGDLWSGNVLMKPRGICIIDWAGSEPAGFGVYDLIRVASSFGLSSWTLRRELENHARILGGSESLKLHLLAALGHYAKNLGEFPLEQLVRLTNESWRRLVRAL